MATRHSFINTMAKIAGLLLIVLLLTALAWHYVRAAAVARIHPSPISHQSAQSPHIACRPSQLPPCAGGQSQWTQTTTPNMPGIGSFLRGVAGSSPSDVWAVGSYYYDNLEHNYPLIEHWNGQKWTIVPSPAVPSGFQAGLGSVTVLSPTDAWAVGNLDLLQGATILQTLIEHWNGQQWSIVPSPNPDGVGGDALRSVSAVSATDVWAVGNTPTYGEPRIEHWDGTQWSYVVSPTLPTEFGADALNSVAAIATNNVWAVGTYLNSTTGFLQTLVEHWDGTQWSVISSPSVDNFEADNDLTSLTAASPQDMWAVGWYNNFGNGAHGPVLEHWNGTQWAMSPLPSDLPANSGIGTIAAAGPNTIYMTGTSGISITSSLIEYWNGTTWHRVPSTALDQAGNAPALEAIVVFSTYQAWVVGYYGSYKTFAGHPNPPMM